MNYRRLLQPRYIFDRAFGLAWGFLCTELELTSNELNPQIQRRLTDFSIEWPTRLGYPAGKRWVETIKSGLKRYITVRDIDIPQLPKAAIYLRLTHRGVKYKVIIDYFDNHRSIFEEYLKDCLLYFKMQFCNEAYSDSRIVPGLFIPWGGLEIYRYLPRLRRIRDKSNKSAFDVYGRFGLYSAKLARGYPAWQEHILRIRSIRAKAIDVLTSQKRFRYQGGSKLLFPTRALTEVARSKVCLDLPGRGPFCFRLIDYLSIGSCIVAYPHEAKLQPALVDGKHVAYCRPDFSDLVDICEYYLTHDRKRREMIEASRQFFDDYLHKDRLAIHYIETLAARINGC